jgi:murein endopeptidase
MKIRLRTVIVMLIASLILVGVVLAATTYVLQLSNEVPVDVNEVNVEIEVPVTLATSSSIIDEGQQITLTAMVLDANVNGYTINFYDNGNPIGSRTISWDGSHYQATLTLTPTVGHHVYTAGP